MKVMNFLFGIAMLLAFVLLFGLLQLSGYGLFMYLLVELKTQWLEVVILGFALLAVMLILAEVMRRYSLPPANVDGSTSSAQSFQMVFCLAMIIVAAIGIYSFGTKAFVFDANGESINAYVAAWDALTSDGPENNFLTFSLIMAITYQALTIGLVLVGFGAIVRLMRLSSHTERTARRMHAA